MKACCRGGLLYYAPYRAEVSYSKTIPAKFPFGQRSFLKATFFDQEKCLLVSKSILRDDMPAVGGTSCPHDLHCNTL